MQSVQSPEVFTMPTTDEAIIVNQSNLMVIYFD